MIDALPPQSQDSEKAYLAACLYDPTFSVEEGIALDLKPEDFIVPFHSEVWSAILKLYDAKQAIDTVTVLAEMKHRDKNVSAVDLSMLSGTAAHSANSGTYAQTIKRKSVFRTLIVAGGDIARIGYNDGPDIETALDKADEVLRRVKNLATISGRSPDPKDIFVRMENITSNGIPTRFPAINAVTGGMQRTHLWVIGAYSNTGKTHVVTNLLEDVARAGGSAMVVSSEMSQEQYMLRAAALTSGVPANLIRYGGMSLEQGTAYRAAKDFWQSSRVKVFDDLYTAARIARKATAMKRDMGLDVMFVDYLQNLGEGGDEYQELRVISRELQLLAKTLGITIIAMSQISNAEARRIAEDGVGDTFEFKGSGTIKDVADLGIMLDRDRRNAPTTMWFHVLKNRHDRSQFKFAANFDLATGKLTQMTDEEQRIADPNGGRVRVNNADS